MPPYLAPRAGVVHRRSATTLSEVVLALAEPVFGWRQRKFDTPFSKRGPLESAKACPLIPEFKNVSKSCRCGLRMQRNDIAAIITKTDIFDFLVDIVQVDDLQGQHGAGAAAFPPDGNGGNGDGAYGLQHPHAAMYYQQQQAQQQLQLHVSLAPGAHKRPLSLELEPSYSAKSPTSLTLRGAFFFTAATAAILSGR
jgi:hypothetical protein